TDIAILTSAPADASGVPMLTNEELAGTRELIDRFAGSGRLLNHTVVHPAARGVLDDMEHWRDAFGPVGWKVYTMGVMRHAEGSGWDGAAAWRLDDQEVGGPFLERCLDLGVDIVCAHKGLSGQLDTG